jgi:hypothetical protein
VNPQQRYRTVAISALLALVLCVSFSASARAEPTAVPPDEVAWDFGSTNAVTPSGQEYNGPPRVHNVWLAYVEEGGLLDLRFQLRNVSSALAADLAAVTLEVISPSGEVVHSGVYQRDELDVTSTA